MPPLPESPLPKPPLPPSPLPPGAVSPLPPAKPASPPIACARPSWVAITAAVNPPPTNGLGRPGISKHVGLTTKLVTNKLVIIMKAISRSLALKSFHVQYRSFSSPRIIAHIQGGGECYCPNLHFGPSGQKPATQLWQALRRTCLLWHLPPDRLNAVRSMDVAYL